MSLLTVSNDTLVQKTNLSKKLTLNGITKVFPVYRVRLDQLFYNDQNDRIATWITQYKADKNNIPFADLSREEYNKIIEKFIVDSNSGAIEKTKNNIALVNQREPGVVLEDGRIIDGNRRFTCLRLLNKEDESVQFFETVILGGDNSPKQIKMLELAIQYGEEQKVGYNLIDLAIGAYHDVVETELLTIEEYAQSTNESVSDVSKRIAVARLINEFLEFMKVPGQYHVAREMQVYSVFSEMIPLLKRCETEESRTELKISVFTDTMMGTVADQRKYIRNVKQIIDNGLYRSYISRQKNIIDNLEKKKEEAEIHTQEDLKRFTRQNESITEDLQVALDRSLIQSKKKRTKERPSQIVSKSISMLRDVDTRIVEGLSVDEKEKLKEQLSRLVDTATIISDGTVESVEHQIPIQQIGEKSKPQLVTAIRENTDPIVYCSTGDYTITTLSFSLPFRMIKVAPLETDETRYTAFFVDNNFQELCSAQEIILKGNVESVVGFNLKARASSLTECLLVIRSIKDKVNEARQLTRFGIKIAFQLDFDF